MNQAKEISKAFGTYWGEATHFISAQDAKKMDPDMLARVCASLCDLPGVVTRKPADFVAYLLDSGLGEEAKSRAIKDINRYRQLVDRLQLEPSLVTSSFALELLDAVLAESRRRLSSIETGLPSGKSILSDVAIHVESSPVAMEMALWVGQERDIVSREGRNILVPMEAPASQLPVGEIIRFVQSVSLTGSSSSIERYAASETGERTPLPLALVLQDAIDTVPDVATDFSPVGQQSENLMSSSDAMDVDLTGLLDAASHVFVPEGAEYADDTVDSDAELVANGETSLNESASKRRKVGDDEGSDDDGIEISEEPGPTVMHPTRPELGTAFAEALSAIQSVPLLIPTSAIAAFEGHVREISRVVQASGNLSSLLDVDLVHAGVVRLLSVDRLDGAPLLAQACRFLALYYRYCSAQVFVSKDLIARAAGFLGSGAVHASALACAAMDLLQELTAKADSGTLAAAAKMFPPTSFGALVDTFGAFETEPAGQRAYSKVCIDVIAALGAAYPPFVRSLREKPYEFFRTQVMMRIETDTNLSKRDEDNLQAIKKWLMVPLATGAAPTAPKRDRGQPRASLSRQRAELEQSRNTPTPTLPTIVAHAKNRNQLKERNPLPTPDRCQVPVVGESVPTCSFESHNPKQK